MWQIWWICVFYTQYFHFLVSDCIVATHFFLGIEWSFPIRSISFFFIWVSSFIFVHMHFTFSTYRDVWMGFYWINTEYSWQYEENWTKYRRCEYSVPYSFFVTIFWISEIICSAKHNRIERIINFLLLSCNFYFDFERFEVKQRYLQIFTKVMIEFGLFWFS